MPSTIKQGEVEEYMSFTSSQKKMFEHNVNLSKGVFSKITDLLILKQDFAKLHIKNIEYFGNARFYRSTFNICCRHMA